MASMNSYNRYKWEKDRLYLYSTDTEIYIERHPDYPNSWCLKFREEMYQDVFNRSWAKDSGIVLHQRMRLMDAEKPWDAFK